MEFLLKVTKVWDTPVFVVHAPDVRFGQIYGATRIKGDPLWYYPAFYPVHRIVLNDIAVLKIPIRFSEAAQRVIDQLDQFARKIEERTLPDAFEFKTKPFEHQLDGLVHVTYNYRAALFYACGLGKSKIIVDWQRAVKCRPLILCPKIVLPVWGVEVKKHGIEQEYCIVDSASKKGKLKQIEESKDYSGLVVTYDTARIHYEAIAATPYNAIVSDESHYMKNFRSGRTKAATELAGKTSRRIIMSGTPSLGDPRDIYPQFRFLAPCLMSENFWHFQNKFCVTAPYNKHIVVGFKNLDVLQQRTAVVSIHRDKDECLDLPERTIIDVLVPLEGKQRSAYNTLVSSKEYQEFLVTVLDERELFSGEGVVDIPNAAVLVSKLLQVASGFIYKKKEDHLCDTCEHVRHCVINGIQPHTKACQVDQTPAEKLVEFLKDNAKRTALMSKLTDILIEPKHKVIIWAQFISELDLLEEALNTHWDKEWHDANQHDGRGKNYHVRVDGATKSAVDQADIFNEDPTCRVYLGQVTKGVGITLNAASYMMYYSLPWRFDAYGQSLDRNYRLGQESKTFVYRFLGKGTVDENVARALNVRTAVADVLTAVFLCSTCERQNTCNELGVEPFEDECKYPRSVERPIAKVKGV